MVADCDTARPVRVYLYKSSAGKTSKFKETSARLFSLLLKDVQYGKDTMYSLYILYIFSRLSPCSPLGLSHPSQLICTYAVLSTVTTCIVVYAQNLVLSIST